MNISNEQALAIKISLILFIFAIFLSNTIPYFNHNFIMWENMWSMMNNWNYKMWYWNFNYYNKIIVIPILTIFIYFIALFLAKITYKPILENNKKLKEYNHTLAHEIKTPLTVLKSNLELLEMWYDKEIVNSSQEEIEYLKNITNDLLFLSENNQLTDKKLISFNKFLQEYKNQEINLNIKNEFTILWNEILIKRLLENLINNALKYKTNWKIDILIDKNQIIFCNKTDLKIENNETQKLFETFYKWTNSTAWNSYWLWLSIVKKICDIHKIFVKIEIMNNYFCVILKK